MSMNFVNAQFLPRINSDKVSCDGYEAKNLILSNNCGFLAESFIKPPVTITILFCCNINIERLVINGKVGCQRSTGFEICTTSFRRKSCSLLTNSVEDDTATFSDKTFLRVGRGYDVNRNVYTFVNPRFSSEVNISHNSDSLLKPPFQLSHHYSKHLSAVSALAVRVTSTLNGSAVAVGMIEVWGEPATDVPKHIITHLRHLQARKLTDLSVRVLTHVNDGTIISSLSQNLGNTAGLDVPIEFLDAVTHELMSLPVLLPCGQTIDQTTLDRFIKEEALWGRTPSDPFTGKAFTSLCHPIQNTSLKVRLDEFVLKQGQNLLHVQLDIGDCGTLGRGRNGNGQKCSRLVEQDLKRPWMKIDAQSAVLTDHDEATNKRLKLDLELKSRCEIGSSVSSTSHAEGSVGCHEDKITTSLDSALRTALSSLPSFTKKVDTNNSKKPIMAGCSTCGAETEEHMYRLKCCHHICRQCLLDIMKSGNKSNCKICHTVVCCHDAVKIHLSRSDFFL